MHAVVSREMLSPIEKFVGSISLKNQLNIKRPKPYLGLGLKTYYDRFRSILYSSVFSVNQALYSSEIF